MQDRPSQQRSYGVLVPLGGGDPIPLLKKHLLVGRRESCDIVLRFSNVSAHHCELTLNGGYWFVRDRKSRNGTKVNGFRVTEKRLDPGDCLAVSKHRYEVQYSPMELGAVGPPPADDVGAEIMSHSLLDRAGIKDSGGGGSRSGRGGRYDVMDDREGQIKDPNRPV